MSFTEAFKAIPQVRARVESSHAMTKKRARRRPAHPLALYPRAGPRAMPDAARQAHEMHAVGETVRGRDIGTGGEGAVRVQGAEDAQTAAADERAGRGERSDDVSRRPLR